MQGALNLFLATQLFSFLLVFARIGSAIMVMPGMSDITVPMNVRLYAALSMCLVLTPFLQKFLPVIPTQPIALAIVIAKEMLIGIFFGLMSQIILNAINVAGFVVAHVTSLSSAFTFNPQQAAQSAVITSFLSLLAVVMLFAMDLHHMLFIGFIDSYRIFVPGNELMFGDITDAITQGLGQSFIIGLEIAAPFIVVGFGVFMAMGLVARLVPQIQVFVLSMPIQILVGLTLLTTCLSAMMLFCFDQYQDFWKNLFTAG